MTSSRLQVIIEEEIGKYLIEAGASQLIGDYNIDVITEDKECIYALNVVKKYVDRRGGWQFSEPEYARVSNILSEAVSLIKAIIDKKEAAKPPVSPQPLRAPADPDAQVAPLRLTRSTKFA